MEKILAAWNLRDIQEYLNIRAQLEKYNKTDQDVKQYLKDEKLRRSKGQTTVYQAINCPTCSNPMLLESINSDPKGSDKINSPEFKSWWRCPNDQTVIYNTKTLQEEINSMMNFATTGITNIIRR